MKDGTICKLFTCDVCGATELKEYKRDTELDGGYTHLSEFEPTSFDKWYINDEWYLLCKNCKSICTSELRRIRAERMGREC